MAAEDTEGIGEVDDGPAARAARDDIVRQVGQLAAAPLDEQAGERLRRALAAAPAGRVRGALRRLAGTSRPGDTATFKGELCVLGLPAAPSIPGVGASRGGGVLADGALAGGAA